MYVCMPAPVDPEDVLADIRRVARELGKVPSYNEYNDSGEYSARLVEKKFGTWVKGRQKAGIEGRLKMDTTNGGVPKTDLLDDLRRVADELGRPPTDSEYDTLGEFSTEVCKKKFESWVDAKKEAGFADYDYSGGAVPKDSLLEDYRSVCEKLGHSATQSEYNRHGEYTERLIYSHFESIRSLRDELGIENPKIGSPKIPEDELISDLQRVNEMVDGVVTQNDYRKYGKYSRRPIQDRIGSFVDFRALAGLHDKNLLTREGSEHPNFREHKASPSIYKTASWRSNRRLARQRDGYQCVHCGKTQTEHKREYGRRLPVHHIIKSHFGERGTDIADESVNTLDNLVTLCDKHHGLYEGMFVGPRELVDRYGPDGVECN